MKISKPWKIIFLLKESKNMNFVENLRFLEKILEFQRGFFLIKVPNFLTNSKFLTKKPLKIKKTTKNHNSRFF